MLNKKRKRQNHVRSLAGKGLLYQMLDFLPSDIGGLVAESLTICEYTWKTRMESGGIISADRKTVEYTTGKTSMTIAQPDFLVPCSTASRCCLPLVPIPDWILTCERIPARAHLQFWTGIGDPVSLATAHAKNTWSEVNFILFRVSQLGGKKVVIHGCYESMNIPEFMEDLSAPSEDFVKYGLRFSLDFASKQILLSIGKHQRSVSFSLISSTWTACGPFVWANKWGSDVQRINLRTETAGQKNPNLKT